nr:mediator complex subunit 28 [Hymenolepis microstoma]
MGKKGDDVLDEFERQCDNLLLSLSSMDFSSQSNFAECRFGDVTEKFIESCRELDSWFTYKRFIINTKCPEYELANEINRLRKELEDKQKYLHYLRRKISAYVSSIDVITEKLADGVAYVPDA